MITDSETIKMFGKAKEIQALWAPKVGDWFYKRDGISFGQWLVCKIERDILFCSSERISQYPYKGQLVEFSVPVDYTWLPTQSQLQEIYLKSLSQDEQESSNIIVVILDDFQDWVLNDCSGLDWSYGGQVSLEQLWLAFVMRELYGKIWDGVDWILEEPQWKLEEHPIK